MMSFQTTVTPGRRAGTRLINDVRRALQKALAEEYAKSKLTQAEIARRIGVHRTVIHRELTGLENITVRRAGELAWAMGRTPRFVLDVSTKSDGLQITKREIQANTTNESTSSRVIELDMAAD